eukprot:364890-Chlamydomonas_euryale.AAC.5
MSAPDTTCCWAVCQVSSPRPTLKEQLKGSAPRSRTRPRPCPEASPAPCPAGRARMPHPRRLAPAAGQYMRRAHAAALGTGQHSRQGECGCSLHRAVLQARSCSCSWHRAAHRAGGMQLLLALCSTSHCTHKGFGMLKRASTPPQHQQLL